jgi:hypothetical protein
MTFKIDNFKVITGKKVEQLQDKIAVSTSIVSGKPDEFVWKNKKREFTIFQSLLLLEKTDNIYYQVISDIFVFIDLIEILKAFIGNKLDTKKEYKIEESFTAKTAQKNGNMSLKIHFKHYSYSLYLDKFECSSLAAKFLKISQRCEAWQDQDQ